MTSRRSKKRPLSKPRTTADAVEILARRFIMRLILYVETGMGQDHRREANHHRRRSRT